MSIGRLKELAITTQVTTENGRPDLELRTSDSLVYVEAKVGSDLRPRQLTCYPDELKRSGVLNTTLILLTRYPPELPPSESPPEAATCAGILDSIPAPPRSRQESSLRICESPVNS